MLNIPHPMGLLLFHRRTCQTPANSYTLALMDPENAQTLSRRARGLYQVTFSDHSMRELNKLPVEDQLALVDKISNVTPEQLEDPDEGVGIAVADVDLAYLDDVRARIPVAAHRRPLDEFKTNVAIARGEATTEQS